MAAKPAIRAGKGELPKGLSPREEAEWWDTHKDYWDAADRQDEAAGPAPVQRTKPITIRLPVGMLDTLKQEAARRAIPYQTLLRMWLKERLDQEGAG